MRIQKSYIDSMPTLYLVPTPIGNYDDMTFRSVEILKNVDIIYCEDTRTTGILLNHFDISTPLKAYHIFNEDVASGDIIDDLRSSKNVGLVSDAGLPVISDPGFFVARLAISEGFNVISLPGANAALTCLVASGIPANIFTFVGFLDHKKSQKIKQLNSLKDKKETLIFYEAPHRIKETLTCILEVMGNREVCLGRELTKKYEEYTRGYVQELIDANLDYKGEIVLVVKEDSQTSTQKKLVDMTIEEHYNYYIDLGNDEKTSMKMVAKDRSVSKSEIYKYLLQNKEENK